MKIILVCIAMKIAFAQGLLVALQIEFYVEKKFELIFYNLSKISSI